MSVPKYLHRSIILFGAKSWDYYLIYCDGLIINPSIKYDYNILTYRSWDSILNGFSHVRWQDLYSQVLLYAPYSISLPAPLIFAKKYISFVKAIGSLHPETGAVGTLVLVKKNNRIFFFIFVCILIQHHKIFNVSFRSQFVLKNVPAQFNLKSLKALSEVIGGLSTHSPKITT